uniref:Peritrophin-1 n=3 Tax=Lygus hesperus TaxID=30085 RepID=A0A146M7V2_LYGHE
MKTTWFVAAALLLFAVSCLCQCADRNGKYPVAGQCDAYVECLDGIPYQRTCPDGLLFKDNYKRGYPCGYPQEVNCEGRAAIQSPQPTGDCPRKFGLFAIGAPNDCGTFMNCAHGRSYIQICPEGLAFNQDTLECDWPDLVPTCDAEAFLGFRCPDNLPESRHASGQCDKYFVCLNGRPRLLRCPSKEAFNPETWSCEDAKNVRNCF